MMNQQFGQFKRGNPLVEQLLGGLSRGMMPKGVALPQQTMQAGMGGMAKFSMGHGMPSNRFTGHSNLRKFLQQYGTTGKVKPRSINLKKLTKF